MAQAALRAESAREIPPYDILPFTFAPGRKGREWWSIPPSGNYAADYAIGEDMARRTLTFCRRHPAAEPGWLVSVILREMAQKGCHSHLLGFAAAVADAAVRGAR